MNMGNKMCKVKEGHSQNTDTEIQRNPHLMHNKPKKTRHERNLSQKEEGQDYKTLNGGKLQAEKH
jgi:hypothetical protein